MVHKGLDNWTRLMPDVSVALLGILFGTLLLLQQQPRMSTLCHCKRASQALIRQMNACVKGVTSTNE